MLMKTTAQMMNYDADDDEGDEAFIDNKLFQFLNTHRETSCYEGETDIEGEGHECYGLGGQIPSKITLDIPRRESWQSARASTG